MSNETDNLVALNFIKMAARHARGLDTSEVTLEVRTEELPGKVVRITTQFLEEHANDN